MGAKRRRWPWVVLGILAFVVVGGYAVTQTAASPAGEYVIDLPALHAAAVGKGPLPERIEVERVGEFAFPGRLVVAGDGFRLHPMVLLVHRVVWPDRSIIVDTAMGPAGAKKIPGSRM